MRVRRGIAAAFCWLVPFGALSVAAEPDPRNALIEGRWTHHGMLDILGGGSDVAIALSRIEGAWTIAYEVTHYPRMLDGGKTTRTRTGPFPARVDGRVLLVNRDGKHFRYTFLLEPKRLVMPAIVETNPGEWLFESPGEHFHVKCENDPAQIPVGKAQIPGVLLGRGYYSFEEGPRHKAWPSVQSLRFLERSDEKGQLVERFRLIFDEYGSPRYERLLSTGEVARYDYQLQAFFATTATAAEQGLAPDEGAPPE